MKIKINLDKAKEIHKNNIRNVRVKKFQELDLEFQKELEKSSPNIAPIVQKKQNLRDLTSSPDIEKAKTIEELKMSWPIETLGESPYTLRIESENTKTPTKNNELIRARNADGTFIADDPSTPDVNEAWVPSKT